MKKYKVWVEIEEVDESKDVYRNIGEPQEAGTFVKKADAEKFIDEHLLMAESLALRLRQLGDLGLKFLASLPQTEFTAELENRSALKRMLEDAIKTPVKPVDDRCPKCGAGSDKRELVDREYLGIEAVHVHYACRDCGSRITEEFTLSEVFIDDGN